MTDAGPLDLLVELRDREGGRHAFAELATRAVPHDVGVVVVRLASLEDIVASKESPTETRTVRRFRSWSVSGTNAADSLS
jgi:hypothetical protein